MQNLSTTDSVDADNHVPLPSSRLAGAAFLWTAYGANARLTITQPCTFDARKEYPVCANLPLKAA